MTILEEATKTALDNLNQKDDEIKEFREYIKNNALSATVTDIVGWLDKMTRLETRREEFRSRWVALQDARIYNKERLNNQK